MEIMNVANQIEHLCNDIARMRSALRKRSEDKALAIVNYYREKTKAVLQLKSEGVQVTLIPELVKGIIHEQLLSREISEGAYEALTTNIKAAQAELNGYQSIFRHLDEK